MPAIESRVEGIWIGKQTAKGTPALANATTNKRFRKVGGDVNVNRDDGSENYSDGTRFGDAADFVNTIVGDGAPVAQATPDLAGYLSYLILGAEAVDGTDDPVFEHVATPGTTGFWFTVWKLVGETIGPVKQKFEDCRMTSLRIEGSSANKVVKLTPTFTSLKAGKVFTTNPVAVSSVENPLLYTEGEGRFEIDGAVFRAHSSFAIVINDPTPPWYGDAVTPEDVTFGIASVTLEGITILVNSQGLQRYNTQIYGNATPPADTEPLKTIPALGSYEVDLIRGADRQLKIEVPGVKWSPDLAIAGNPDGGPVELALAGEARKSGSDPFIRITTRSEDEAYV